MTIIGSKTKAHQDVKKRLEDLSWFELLNVKCDSRANHLIQHEDRHAISFPIYLSSPCLSSRLNNLLLNTKEIMLVTMSMSRARAHVSEKLRNSAALDIVDWTSRGKAVPMVIPLFKAWLSKSFTNFAATSHRMKQKSLWNTSQCRCCATTTEVDTFHILHYSNELLKEERHKIFEMLFNNVARYEVPDELKELMYQVLTGDPDYVHPD